MKKALGTLGVCVMGLCWAATASAGGIGGGGGAGGGAGGGGGGGGGPSGAVTRGAKTISSTEAATSGSKEWVIDQSGLSGGYVNGVTNYAAFVAATTHADQDFGAGGNAFNTNASSSGTFVFDLGSSYQLNGIAVWNIVAGDAAMRDFQLSADSDGDPTNGGLTALGSYTLGRNAAQPNFAFTFSFAPVTTRYMVFHWLNSYSTGTLSALSEVVFSQVGTAVVSAPASGALVLAALAAAGFGHRRQNRFLNRSSK